jgi:Fur family transcriptional regulator, ferric uptake regulator
MNPLTVSFTELLKTSGNSVTEARTKVFTTLLGKEPLSMGELVGQVKGVDRASVYRAIDLFERLGIVQRLYTGWKYKLELTDKFAEHHHHLTCIHCGRTIPMNEAELESVIERLSATHDFVPAAHQIEIQGACKACRDKAVSRQAPTPA